VPLSSTNFMLLTTKASVHAASGKAIKLHRVTDMHNERLIKRVTFLYYGDKTSS